ncbi:MAG: inositol-3-phosphate synthase [Thermodesulfobacteriota bacterium]
MSMTDERIGIWCIGARGAIAVSLMAGTLACRHAHSTPLGLITATDLFAGIDLAPLSSLVFGGCDIRREDLESKAEALLASFGLQAAPLLAPVRAELAAIDRRITPGTAANCGDAIARLAECSLNGGMTLGEQLAAIRSQLNEFRNAQGLDRVVVVNLASTEPPLPLHSCHQDPARLAAAIAANDLAAVRASSLYAWAAVLEDCPYLNFTPSDGALLPAVVALAEARKIPVMGNDGKTGETLLKTALAPMFASRNLKILSWEGFNILGNDDGIILDDPENKASKLRTKDRVLGQILGYAPHSGVHINLVPSLGDQKTAWDFVHFEGFLGAKMSLQFTWQGYDSLLAAPLVLDMARLAALAAARGEGGLMPHLASFFKAPLRVDVHGHAVQFALLTDYVRRLRKDENG